MTYERMSFNAALLIAAVLTVGLFVFDGCRKKSPQPVSPPSANAPAAVMTTEQTMCPVMGGAIDKSIFVEYKGKKVYFCCPSCKGEFEKDPEKYISKLPQFAK